MSRHVVLAALALLLTAGLTACKERPHLLDPGAMLYINIANNNTKAMDDKDKPHVYPPHEERIHTPREIVERAFGFALDTNTGIVDGVNGISDEMKDFEHNRIKMWGQQIIREDGTLEDYFMTARNVRIIDGMMPDPNDCIIAYIPNKVMQEGWVKIQEAYNEGNYDEVYRLFQQVYTAIPITSAQYAELRKRGEN